MNRVFVQQGLDGEWISQNCYSSAKGFRERGYEVIPFTENDLRGGKLPLSRETIVHGSINMVQAALKQVGVRLPELLDYPHCLRRGFLDREPQEAKLKQILEKFHKPDFSPVFIKPSRSHKLFTGFVVEEFSDLLKISHVDNEERVWVMPPVEFLSEYRIFVLHGQVVGMKHYSGDPFVFPDPEVLRKMLKRAEALPQAAYAIDIGVAYFPERPEKIQTPTLLVEVNDSFALGAYGLSSWIYVQMIEARWKQIVEK